MILRRSCWQAEPTIEFHPSKIRDTSINEIRITLRKSIAFTYCSTLSPTLRDPISQIQTPPEMESEQQAMVPRFQLIKGFAIWSTVWHLGETWRKHNSGALPWNDPGCKIHRSWASQWWYPWLIHCTLHRSTKIILRGHGKIGELSDHCIHTYVDFVFYLYSVSIYIHIYLQK